MFFIVLLLKSIKLVWNIVSFTLIMKFVLKPSLEHRTLVKIGISLWNQNDVRALISKLCKSLSYTQIRRAWKKLEESVIEKVSQLSLPQSLKEKVLGVIKPIGIEIFEWMQRYLYYNIPYGLMLGFHSLDLDLSAYLPTELCWTPQGTVDRKRTAEVLVKDESLNVFTRYIVACIYCLEGDIIRFWNRLPEYLKNYDWHSCPLISFWSDNMKRGGAGHISYKDEFYCSVQCSNEVAAKYFLQKVTPQEREEILEEYDAGFCGLLHELEEEEQKKVLKNNPTLMLQCLLRWPWQSFFIGVANCMWDFLSKKNFEYILGDIIGKVREGYKDYNYQKLFEEFWQKSPSALKDSFLDEIDKSCLLRCLFDIKDKENIRFILKDATLTSKKKLIYSDEIHDCLIHSIWANEWDFLEFCIRECLPSKDEMLKFKEEFEKRSPYPKKHLARHKQWDELFRFSDDSICKYNKRCLEEGESSSSKRFQNLE